MISGSGLWELVEQRAALTPDARFAVDESDRELSFSAYRDAALRCAAGLARLGVAPGCAVSWMLPTWLESLVLVAALSRLGAVQNPVLPSYRRRELGFIVAQSGAELLVVPRVWRGFDYEKLAGEIAARRDLRVLVIDRELPQADPEALPPAPQPTDAQHAPTRWLFYSSGTTADPKGTLHTDQTLLAASLSLCRALELRDDDRIALVFPLTHIGGISWLYAGLLVGCSQIAVAVFDPETSSEVLARYGVTQATAGTVFHQAYLAAQRARGGAPLFPEVRAFPGGGAPKPATLHYELRRELGGAGIVSGYGLTECPMVTMGSVRDPDEKLAHSEGRATAGMEIAIVKLDGEPAASGEEGEIRVRGPQLCRGYLDPELDRDGFDKRGYLRTGDLGSLDGDGYLRITGRKKDVIIRKGENISASELEDLLYRHPKVRDVAVIGLPDPESGERCCAVVACNAGEELGFEEMVSFLKQAGLMPQKIPEQLELVDELPRSPTGKIPKHELRARYAQRPDTR